jgi:hypothetical protein
VLKSVEGANSLTSLLKQIKDWFKNHTRASGSMGQGQRPLLNLSQKKAKKLPVWQAYSKHFYEEKLKEVVQVHWNAKFKTENPEHDEENTPIPPPPLQFRNEVIRTMYEEESEEVKKEIEVYRDKQGIEASEMIDDDGVGHEESDRRKVAATYQS